MSLSTQILTDLAMGLGVGIFLGELVAPLGTVGRAFILLLQMTVLPYVAISLVASLGSLRYQEATLLARKADRARHREKNTSGQQVIGGGTVSSDCSGCHPGPNSGIRRRTMRDCDRSRAKFG